MTVVSLRCLLLGFAELWWMDVVVIGATDYLSTKATLVQREWVDRPRPFLAHLRPIFLVHASFVDWTLCSFACEF
jgi:hypothetical protein